MIDFSGKRALTLRNLFRRRRPLGVVHKELSTAADRAGELFDRGFNCAQAILQATTGREDRDFIALAEGFTGGIGHSGCLCGAVSGGVMALGLAGRADRAAQLIANFKDQLQTTCCRSLSKKQTWLSKEHLANCRRITTRTAAMVEELLDT